MDNTAHAEAIRGFLRIHQPEPELSSRKWIFKREGCVLRAEYAPSGVDTAEKALEWGKKKFGFGDGVSVIESFGESIQHIETR